MSRILCSFFVHFGLFWVISPGFSQELFQVSDPDVEEFALGKNISYLVDSEGHITVDEVMSGLYDQAFLKSEKEVLFFGITPEIHWFRIKIQDNVKSRDNWLLQIKFEQHSRVDFYEVKDGNVISEVTAGFKLPFHQRPILAPDFAFPIDIGDGEVHEYIVRIDSDRTKIVPFFLTTKDRFFRDQSLDNISYGIYFGVLFGLLLYNLFLFLGLKDQAYLYYIFSIFSSGLLFATTSGDFLEFIVPNQPVFGRKTIELASCLVALSTSAFAKAFLEIKSYSRVLFWSLNVIMVIAVITIPIVIWGDLYFVQNITYNMLSILILILLASGIVSWRKGNKYALLYTIAWVGYLVGGLITMARDLGVLEFNFFTSHAVEYGSGLEVILLAMALSRRYNDYRKEKEDAIQRSLDIQKEATETLEQKVEERTSALNETLEDLKDTQGQLVLAEKMASLGQLTAGVAHEINNPINFVSSNIATLKLNLQDMIEELEKSEELDEDLKYTIEESKQLLKVMEEGTTRTTEIVKGLRNFSRLDESDQKEVSINECIESTLSMVSNEIKFGDIEVKKDLTEIPVFEGNPGQLNQVFMNLFTNAMHAMKDSDLTKQLYVSSEIKKDMAIISVRDTGKGMPADVIEKIFDPFFTTKDVGEGTGLGLSISYGIIERHGGTLEVESKVGEGTVFQIKIPVKSLASTEENAV